MANLFKAPVKTQAGSIAWLNECIERGKCETFTEHTILTPGLAAELLRRNDGNRYVSYTKVLQYAADMKNGRWEPNGENIIISDTGLLNDGQHRCHGLIEANVTIPVSICFGPSRASRLTVDQGAARGASAYAQMLGVPNATASSTIARMVIAYERTGGESVENKEITNGEILDRISTDPLIAKSATFAAGMGSHCSKLIPGTVIGFCFYVFSKIDEDGAREFLTQVSTGADLKAKSPALAIRDKMLSIGKARGPKVSALFHGWNFYRRNMGTSLANLQTTLPLRTLI